MIYLGGISMDSRKILNVLDVYYRLCSLKTAERTGWIEWNISAPRIESIPEHVFGAEQLAWLMYSESGIDLDIFKVIAMLSIHETEEAIIGDITPFSNVTPEEKLQMGKLAVEEVLLCKLNKKQMMIALIDEFNEKKTKEAQFAYLCDKMECDLMAKKYSDAGYGNIQNADEKITNDEKIQKIIANGATTMADVFVEFDKGKYDGTIFADLLTFLRDYKTN